MQKHYTIQVFGKVQGVYFRASTQAEAQRLGLNGFVRNEADGSVYIEAEGAEEQLHQLVEWCHEGPSRARVERVEHTAAETLKGFTGFEIRR